MSYPGLHTLNKSRLFNTLTPSYKCSSYQI